MSFYFDTHIITQINIQLRLSFFDKVKKYIDISYSRAGFRAIHYCINCAPWKTGGATISLSRKGGREGAFWATAFLYTKNSAVQHMQAQVEALYNLSVLYDIYGKKQSYFQT
jgi:hypothetical protein